jgi:serine/threonine-protein kinase
VSGAAASEDPRPGDVVAGRFRIEERLGAGGMGIVYRARQTELDREVALKVLHRRFGDDDRARARFEREARVASALPHPSAVGIYDFGTDRGRIFMAMELLTGGSLRAALAEPGARWPLSRILDVSWQIADTLAAAHRLPLVHRDLKPENVFLEPEAAASPNPTGTDRVRIVDFGLAFIAGGGDERDRLTVEGVVTGTPEYLSPEQARGDARVGPATDVYALGCVLYELLTGRVPFEGTEMEVLTKQLFSPAPALGDLRDGLVVPAALEALVGSMLRKRPADRPAADEARDALLRVDPDLVRAGRARDDRYLLGRAARMVPARAAPDVPADGDAVVEVAIVGAPHPDLLVALTANGLAPFVVTDDQPIGDADVVWAPGLSPDDIGELARATPVVTDTDSADVERITAMLRAGAAEVIARPVAADQLVRRLRRALRRRRRRR